MKRIIAILICLVLAACGGKDAGFVKAGESVIGSGSLGPVDNVTDLSYIARKASTQTQYEAYWKQWEIKGEMKVVDFTKYDTYFILVYGSSSCPPEISQYLIQGDTLYIKLQSEDGICTTDMAPVSYVLKTDKHNEVTKLKVNEYGNEVTIDLVQE